MLSVIEFQLCFSLAVVGCQEGIEDRLDVRRFPFLAGGSRSVGLGSAPVRY